jgi:lysophospholipase L1-like esterase
MIKTILCYGDSNLWGRNPVHRTRFAPAIRWPGVLQEHLGKEFRIIEEGLPGRTTVLDDPIDGPAKNGKRYLEPCLASHAPIDLVIFMLGACDMKKRFSLCAFDIAAGMEQLIRMAQQSAAGPNQEAPVILILSPIAFGSRIGEIFHCEGAEDMRRELASLYEQLAKQYECGVLDMAKFATASEIDSIHLDAEGHRKVGVAVAATVQILMSD